MLHFVTFYMKQDRNVSNYPIQTKNWLQETLRELDTFTSDDFQRKFNFDSTKMPRCFVILNVCSRGVILYVVVHYVYRKISRTGIVKL